MMSMLAKRSFTLTTLRPVTNAVTRDRHQCSFFLARVMVLVFPQSVSRALLGSTGLKGRLRTTGHGRGAMVEMFGSCMQGLL